MSKHHIHVIVAIIMLATASTPSVVAQSLGSDVIAQSSHIGRVYEAYLSPHQEPGEERDTPKPVPKVFQSAQAKAQLINGLPTVPAPQGGHRH